MCCFSNCSQTGHVYSEWFHDAVRNCHNDEHNFSGETLLSRNASVSLLYVHMQVIHGKFQVPPLCVCFSVHLSELLCNDSSGW